MGSVCGGDGSAGEDQERGRLTIKETLTERERYKLLLVRDIAEELERLEDHLQELHLQTISSPKMDGMPGGGAQSDPMAVLMIRKQRTEERIAETKERLKKAQSAAKKAIQGLPVAKRLFYEAYFVYGDKLESAAVYAGICQRTGSSYIKQVK